MEPRSKPEYSLLLRLVGYITFTREEEYIQNVGSKTSMNKRRLMKTNIETDVTEDYADMKIN
jgi:hypothetical protein